MSNITRTIGRSLPNGDYIQATAVERDGSDGLSAGFSITGELWEKRGTRKGSTRKSEGREPDAGGCLHDEILRAFPKLAPIVKVHLADLEGVPMHAKANGWYFYHGQAEAYERNSGRPVEMSGHDRAAQALHIDPAELPRDIESREAFGAFVDSLTARYAADAEAAREAMRGMSA